MPGTMDGSRDQSGEKTLRFDAQSVGSAITYGRRYGLSAILGIASEEDDDGNGASGSSGGKPAKKKDKKTSAPQDKPFPAGVPDPDPEAEKRQILWDDILDVMHTKDGEDAAVFTVEERKEVSGLVKKAKTLTDLSAIRNTWSIKRDQRRPPVEAADSEARPDDFKDDIPEVPEKPAEKQDEGLF